MILQAIEASRTLRSLDLSFCCIDSHSAFVLAESLGTNRSILKLNLEGNPLGSEGAQALLRTQASDPNIVCTHAQRAMDGSQRRACRSPPTGFSAKSLSATAL